MLEGRRKEKLYYEESNGKKLKDKDKYDGEVWVQTESEIRFIINMIFIITMIFE